MHKTHKIYVLGDAYQENLRFESKDYRCNRIEIEILKEAYLEPNWQLAVKTLFKEVAKLYRPFYAEIIEEERSMICGWWWKGIPAKRGEAIIIGEPYGNLCGRLPDENRIEEGLYYFDNPQRIKIPRCLISKKKTFAKKTHLIFKQTT